MLEPYLFNPDEYLAHHEPIDGSASAALNELAASYRLEIELEALQLARRAGFDRVMVPHVVEGKRELDRRILGRPARQVAIEGMAASTFGAGLSGLPFLLSDQQPIWLILMVVAVLAGGLSVWMYSLGVARSGHADSFGA